MNLKKKCKKNGSVKLVLLVFLLIVFGFGLSFLFSPKKSENSHEQQQKPTAVIGKVKSEQNSADKNKINPGIKTATSTIITPVSIPEVKEPVIDKPAPKPPEELVRDPDPTPETTPEKDPKVPEEAETASFCLFEDGVKAINKEEKNIVFGGIPRYTKDSESLKILHNIGYYVGYSERHKNPIWVCYRLDYMEDTDPYKRPGGFKPDPRTDSMVKQRDYTKSGYDRGHMAPNSSISDRFGREAQIETFMMSNITPQKPKLNRKVWQRLESLEADLANKCETVWVVTGPIFDDHIERLKSGVEIPDAFFKILIDEKDGKLRALPFIIPQTVKGRESLEQFLTSIDEIENQTGIDLFWAISDRYENYLESQIPERIW